MKTFISRTGSRSPHLTEQPTLSLQEKRKPGLREDRAGSRVGFTLGAASMQQAFPTSRVKSSRQYPAHDGHVGQRHSPGGHECPEQDTEGPKGPQAHRRHSHWGAAEAQVGCDTHPPHPPPAYRLLGAGTQRLRLTGAGAQPPGLLCTEAQRNHGC